MQRTEIPLHFAQTFMNYIDTLHSDNNRSAVSNDRSAAVKINGPVNTAWLLKAFAKLIERHEALRCYKDSINATLVVLNPDEITELPISVVDASALRPAPPLKDALKTLKCFNAGKFSEERFQLDKAPLWRAKLIKCADNQYQLVFLFHHIIVDEVSIGNILKDLSAFYNAIANNKEPSLPPLPPLNKVDLRLPESVKQERLKFWEEEMKDLNQTDIHPDSPAKKSFPFPGKRVSFILKKEVLDKINSSIKAHQPNGKYSNNIILLGCLYTVLYSLTGEKDICNGITSANRLNEKIPELPHLVNAFFNSIPLRVKFDGTNTILDLFEKIRVAQSKALKNQLPIDVIMKEAISLKTKNALSFANPFTIMSVLNQKKPTLTFDGTTAEYPIELDLGQCKMPNFGINIDELYNDDFRITIEYNTDIHQESTMERFIERYKKTLESFAANPTQKLDEVSVLLEEELRLIKQFNHTDTLPTSSPRYIHDWLHHIALSSPDKIALQYHKENGLTEVISYKELDEKSTLLANYLRSQNIKSGMSVGVCLPQSIDFYVAMFATFKLGGVLVNLDENDPATPNKMRDARVQAIVCNESTRKLSSGTNSFICSIDHPIQKTTISASESTYIPPLIDPTSPAYMMYTSGTSGLRPQPKGVICSHDSLSNLLESLMQHHSQHRPGEPFKLLSTVPTTFDASIYDVLKTLAEAGEMHFNSEVMHLSPGVIQDTVFKHGIDFAVFTPSLMRELNPKMPLTEIISMGEAPRADLVERWYANDPTGKRVIYNGYGPTEGTICTSTQILPRTFEENMIGKPINNTQMFILNPDNHNLCPLNVPGEIFIAGRNVANGYWNNAEVNAQKFLWMRWDEHHHRFQISNANDRNAIKFFATGDYGCYKQMADKSIAVELIGRKDTQVKVNGGVRVDVSAIESLLRTSVHFKDVVISYNEGSGLCAYVDPVNTTANLKFIRSEIRHIMSNASLPPATFPKGIFKVSSIPKNRNGKVDLRQLPQMVLFDTPNQVPYRTALQTTLIQLWAEALAPEGKIAYYEKLIDTDTTFAELGGDSLNLARLELLINSRLQLTERVGFPILSKAMTIESLEERILPLLSYNQYLATPFNTSVYDGILSVWRPQNTGQNSTQTKEPGQTTNLPFRSL